mmetsp:Transcript_4910/g.7657  ORF Transcript_4910/g.7657 Transcript_4910/m.7657 type:complete len:263 (-) Transcript_4910:399-1187(-)
MARLAFFVAFIALLAVGALGAAWSSNPSCKQYSGKPSECVTKVCDTTNRTCVVAPNGECACPANCDSVSDFYCRNYFCAASKRYCHLNANLNCRCPPPTPTRSRSPTRKPTRTSTLKPSATKPSATKATRPPTFTKGPTKTPRPTRVTRCDLEVDRVNCTEAFCKPRPFQFPGVFAQCVWSVLATGQGTCDCPFIPTTTPGPTKTRATPTRTKIPPTPSATFAPGCAAQTSRVNCVSQTCPFAGVNIRCNWKDDVKKCFCPL